MKLIVIVTLAIVFEIVNCNDADIIEDATLKTPELIIKYGYPCKTYYVTTSDGYILQMHRIPASPTSPPALGKKVAFLMHGILGSSATWNFMGPTKGFTFMLADLGYDVWMGNARGNRYSRNHVTLNPDTDMEFWSFSWHEIGIYDLPAMIDFVLAKTNQAKLHYIGHSQGTTVFFVMCSMVPQYNTKIISMQALAPVAFMSHLKSPLVLALVPLLDTLSFTALIGSFEFMSSNELLLLGGYESCSDESYTQLICSNILFLMSGFDSDQLNYTRLPVIAGHTPAGASSKQIIHYTQEVPSGKFAQYDYGIIANLIIYGRFTPPSYDLKKIKAPVALHYGLNDWLADPTDVNILYNKLPNVMGKFVVPYNKFNHLDFVWAIDVRTLLYQRVITIMKSKEI